MRQVELGGPVGYRKADGLGMSGDRRRQVKRVLWIVLGLNVGVALAKLTWGLVIGSVAMQADGFHSLFDGVSNIVGLIGLGVASRPADRGHPYGHSKFETYASAGIGAMLAIVAYNVGSSAVAELVAGAEPPRVDSTAFAVMLITLTVNLVVTSWERRVGRRMNSEILVADARHTLSDVYVSLGVIAGLIAVRLGYPAADPLVGLAVAAAIGYTAWQVFRQAGRTLSDASRIAPDEIRAVLGNVEGVLGCHDIRTRGLEGEVYVDLHVQVDPAESLTSAHEIAERVERLICEAFPQVVDVIVHVEPYDGYQAGKTREQIDAENR